MKSQPLFRTVLVIGACAAAGSLWAQDFATIDGRTYVMDSFTGQAEEKVTAKAVPDSAVPSSAKKPVILNFNVLPPRKLWESYNCFGRSKARVSHGILTIRSGADCHEYFLWHFNNTWHNYVDFDRGWIIETSLHVDPRTEPDCDDGSVLIWAHDHTKLVIIGFSTHEICIAYPDNVRVPMDTTDGFHVYRIETKGRRVKVFADGELKIDHNLSWRGGGTDVLAFGDGVVGTRSLTRWDYFSYDIFP